MKKIQIIILSRDRVNYLRECIKSVTEQKIENFELEILISDSSETDTVETFIKNSYPSLRYIRRAPSRSVWDHFRLAIKDASGDYIVIFHDDDILYQNYCLEMLAAFERYPDASAIGCNAITIDKQGREAGLHFTRQQNKIIIDEKWFLSQYIPNRPATTGHPPFPSYCYRFSALDINHVNENDGGACADVTFISKKVQYGPIIWLVEPLMKYRVHNQSGTAGLTLNDYRKLWRYMELTGLNKHENPFLDWRYSVWYSLYFKKKCGNKKYKLIIPSTSLDALIHKSYLMRRIFWPRLTYMRMLLGYIWWFIFVRKT